MFTCAYLSSLNRTCRRRLMEVVFASVDQTSIQYEWRIYAMNQWIGILQYMFTYAYLVRIVPVEEGWWRPSARQWTRGTSRRRRPILAPQSPTHRKRPWQAEEERNTRNRLTRYTYKCIHIYIYIYTSIYIYRCIYIHIHIYICVYLCLSCCA